MVLTKRKKATTTITTTTTILFSEDLKTVKKNYVNESDILYVDREKWRERDRKGEDKLTKLQTKLFSRKSI